MKRIILMSGGLDSFILWALSGSRPNLPKATNLFVSLGHKYEAIEMATLIRLRSAVEEFDFKHVMGASIGDTERVDGIIPYRNAHLLLAAASFANATPKGDVHLLMGVVADEINSDKSVEFMQGMQDVLDVSMKAQYWNRDKSVSHQVYSPIAHFTKSELVAQYLQRGFNKEALYLTRSCYSEEVKHCGHCASCFKKWVAFVNNDIGEKDMFAEDPYRWAKHTGIIEKCHDGTYTHRRAAEILSAVGTYLLGGGRG